MFPDMEEIFEDQGKVSLSLGSESKEDLESARNALRNNGSRQIANAEVSGD